MDFAFCVLAIDASVDEIHRTILHIYYECAVQLTLPSHTSNV